MTVAVVEHAEQSLFLIYDTLLYAHARGLFFLAFVNDPNTVFFIYPASSYAPGHPSNYRHLPRVLLRPE